MHNLLTTTIACCYQNNSFFGVSLKTRSARTPKGGGLVLNIVMTIGNVKIWLFCIFGLMYWLLLLVLAVDILDPIKWHLDLIDQLNG